MKSKSLIILVSVLILALIPLNYIFLGDPQIEEAPDFFVGVDVAYADLEAIKRVIDEVSSYTNLFVIGSTGISSDKIKLDETCQYLYDKDMYFIIYHHDHFRLQLTSDIEKKYGDHFLGVYFDDEQGGKQLDSFDLRWVNEAENYTDAANQFVAHLNYWLNNAPFTRNGMLPQVVPSDFRLFTSDYSLYWFDYKAGYDVVFAEFGWNYSRQLNVALDRGAATVQNKDWGVIITWTYNYPPYIESGEELYEDLILAYNNGAKYILVFDTNENYTEGILEEEHFEALEQFWQYTQDNPRNNLQVEKRVAFVLPKDYGYGFRGPTDKIWGLWGDDVLSLEISHHLGSFLEEYGTKLDIIYDDDIKFNEVYSKYIFWNGIIISDS